MPEDKWIDVTDKFYTPKTPESAFQDVDVENLPHNSVAYQAAKSLQWKQMGGDIPPSSPLGQETPGFAQRLVESVGAPTTVGGMAEQALSANPLSPTFHPMLLKHLFEATGALRQAPTVAEAGKIIYPPAANLGTDIGDKNWAGVAGTVLPQAIMALIGREGSRVKVGEGMEPVYGEAPKSTPPGPIRKTMGNLAGFVMPEKLHSALKPLWGATPGKPPIIGYNAKEPFNMPPRTAAVQKPPVSNPAGMKFAAGPGQLPLPINEPALQAYGTPPPMSSPAEGGVNSILGVSPAAVTRAAITSNESLLPGGNTQVAEPPINNWMGQPAEGSAPPVQSPAAYFSQQSLDYLMQLLKQNKKALPAPPPADWKLGTPTSQGGFGRGSKAIK